MRKCLVEVQDEPICMVQGLSPSIQELRGKRLIVNLSENTTYGILLNNNPELIKYCDDRKEMSKCNILDPSEFKIIMEIPIE